MRKFLVSVKIVSVEKATACPSELLKRTSFGVLIFLKCTFYGLSPACSSIKIGTSYILLSVE